MTAAEKILDWINSPVVREYCAKDEERIIEFLSGYDLIKWYLAWIDADLDGESQKDIAYMFYNGFKGYKDYSDAGIMLEMIGYFNEDYTPEDFIREINEFYDFKVG
jgi:hypothetical protein